MPMFAKRPWAGASAAASNAGPPAVPPAEIATVFVQLRHYLQISLYQAAALLNTEPDVITALETGTLSDLPAWPETVRIVSAYASLANIDPAPVLSCLESHVRPALDEGAASRKGRGNAPAQWRWPQFFPRGKMIWRLGVVAIALAILSLGAGRSVLEAAVSTLPSPVGQIARETQDMVLVRLSPTFEGMPWISVNDPRSRRADKLRIERR